MTTALLETHGLSLSFGGVVAADSIDFTLATGERLAVVVLFLLDSFYSFK